MPSLIRLISVLAILAALGFAGVWVLANMIEPQMREITITIPADKIGK